MVNVVEITNKIEIANKNNNYFINLPNNILNEESFSTDKQEKTIFLYKVCKNKITNIVREQKNTNCLV